MLDNRYAINPINEVTYEFISEGVNGSIRKIVLFQKIDETLFNIAFGDWDESTQKVNDQSTSNNSDRNRVMGTISFIVAQFLSSHPRFLVFAKGNTVARNRLYQAVLARTYRQSKTNLQYLDIQKDVGDHSKNPKTTTRLFLE